MTREIKKVAVLGGGIMGSGIAAHLANAGIPSVILDIVPRELTEHDKSAGIGTDSPAFRNRFSQAGIQNALKARPAAFYHKSFANMIQAGNYEDNMDMLQEVDWVVEAVVENLDIKKKVFESVEKNVRPGTLVTSNTSGIPLRDMLEGRGEDFRRHFFITHFFNPVRYLKLLELVQGTETSEEVVQNFASFGENVLGKGIVWAKDTPSFIGNRIGIFAIMNTVKWMMDGEYKIEEVDKLFGPPMGRPKSAAFRTADLVGIDTFLHVADNCYKDLPDDEARDIFKAPQFMRTMMDKGWLGSKAKQGFYKKDKDEKGKRVILSMDYNTMDYNPQVKVKYKSLKDAKKFNSLGERIKHLVWSEDRGGEIAWKVTRDTLLYSARRIPEIADDVVNIDNGMKWGFGWEMGPFETWDAIGLKESVERMEKEGFEIPSLVEDVLKKGGGAFYTRKEGSRYFFDVGKKDFQLEPKRSYSIELLGLKEKEKVVLKNDSTNLIDLGDGVACLEFNSKMNAIDDDIIQMMFDAEKEVKKNFEGLVIGNQADHFSVGANLFMISLAIQNKEWDRLGTMVDGFQQANQLMKYCDFPTVSTPHGMVLGGGCEVCLGTNAIIACGETYMGLVEVGAGVIPAGGGCKEMLIRNLGGVKSDTEVDIFSFARRAFMTLGMAKVATSGVEAQDLSFLSPTDKITINKDRLLFEAKQMVLGMARAGFTPPRVRTDIRVAGETGYANLCYGVNSMKESGWISEYDEFIGKKLAYVLCGGDVPYDTKVDEDHLLALEKEAFLSLCGQQKTLDRMQSLVMTGKPLRN